MIILMAVVPNLKVCCYVITNLCPETDNTITLPYPGGLPWGITLGDYPGGITLGDYPGGLKRFHFWFSTYNLELKCLHMLEHLTTWTQVVS